MSAPAASPDVDTGSRFGCGQPAANASKLAESIFDAGNIRQAVMSASAASPDVDTGGRFECGQPAANASKIAESSSNAGNIRQARMSAPVASRDVYTNADRCNQHRVLKRND